MARKKAYEVINATKNPARLNIDGREIVVSEGGKRGVTTIHDAGLAREIEARHGDSARTKEGGKVIVIEVDDRDKTHEPGHQYSFSVPDMSRFKGYRDRKK